MNIIRPQQFKARLSNREDINDKFSKYVFELVNPSQMQFHAGQYVSIKVSEQGARRSYSICSTPDLDYRFELLVDHTPNGIGTQYLKNLQMGQEVDILSPLGQFHASAEHLQGKDEIVMVATGSGIAPFKGILEDLLRLQGEKRKITLYWGMRFVEDLFWLEYMDDMMDSFKNFSFHPVISKSIDEWPLCRGRVTDCLSVHAVPVNAAYYLCGNANMITEVNQLLQSKGVAPEAIHFEKFY